MPAGGTADGITGGGATVAIASEVLLGGADGGAPI